MKNVLNDVAIWKNHTENPDESGNYLVSIPKDGIHHWGYNKDLNQWGNGIYIPGPEFRWLNVRISILD